MADALLLKIRGSVQGVSFRASMARLASEAGVKGWVRNLPDGSVEAFLEGDESDVRKVLAWARVGPPRARVDRVDVGAADPKNYRDFSIQ